MNKSITEQEYNKASDRLEEIIDMVDDNAPGSDLLLKELIKISDIIEAYEEIHYPIGEPTMLEVLKLRMTDLVQNSLIGFKR